MSAGANVKSDATYNAGVLTVSDAAIRRIYTSIGIDYDSGQRVMSPEDAAALVETCVCFEYAGDNPACLKHGKSKNG